MLLFRGFFNSKCAQVVCTYVRIPFPLIIVLEQELLNKFHLVCSHQ